MHGQSMEELGFSPPRYWRRTYAMGIQALGLWRATLVKAHWHSAARLCRYADDGGCACRYQDDAERFFRVLPTSILEANIMPRGKTLP